MGLTDHEQVAWLRLARTSNVGPVTFAQLLARFGSASAALVEVPRLVRRGGGAAPTIPSAADIHAELEALAALGGQMIVSQAPEFPRGLAALDAPPPVIFVLGNPVLLGREMVAMVGARNASALGRKLAQNLATELGASGLVIASGMARGIDTAAHVGSLATGTCAVVAGGIDVIYPPENAGLYDRIKAEGVIVSEMPIRQQPQARHFPRRNRIISGLARGVIVVEASEGSGSLITANFALEQNREVFAVPGSPLDPRARGANRLLRQGAVLTETAEDVLSVLRPILGGDFNEPENEPVGSQSGLELSDADDERLRTAVSDALGPAPVEVNDLIRLSGAPASAVLTVLLELELAGKLARHPGNKVSWSA